MHAVEVEAAISILKTGVLLVHRRDPEQGNLLKAGLAQPVLPAFSGRVRRSNSAVTSCCAVSGLPWGTKGLWKSCPSLNCNMYPILRREVSGGDFETVILRSPWGVNHE